MNKQPLGSFQLFALCAFSCSVGIFVTTGNKFSPAYFWLTTGLFALQTVGIWLLGRSFDRTGCADAAGYLSHILSFLPARLLLGHLGLLLVCRSALTLSVQTDCISLYLLEDTPDFAIVLVLLLTSFGALLPGLRRLSGVSVLLAMILPMLILLIVVCGLIAADYGQMKTLTQPAADEFADAFPHAALTVSGTVCTLFFLGREHSERKAIKGAAAAPAVCGAIFILLSLTAVGTIGIDGMASDTFSLVEASRQISFGGIELTERFDLPLVTASLFASVVQMAIFTLCAAISFCAAFNSQRAGKIAVWLLPVEFTAALFIQYTALGEILQWLCAVGLTAFGAILFLLPALAAIKKKPITSQEKTV